MPVARRASRISGVQEELFQGPSEDGIVPFNNPKLEGKVAHLACETRLISRVGDSHYSRQRRSFIVHESFEGSLSSTTNGDGTRRWHWRACHRTCGMQTVPAS